MLIVDVMGQEYRAIYGSLQEPQMARRFCDNPRMDITQAIAKNLGAWMEDAPEDINTIKKLAAKAGVGFGTVRRARNGDGNITVQNLEAIARTFKRHAVDLIATHGENYESEPTKPTHHVAEKIAHLQPADPLANYLRELTALASAMNDEGRWQLIGQAKLLATTNPKAKANPAN